MTQLLARSLIDFQGSFHRKLPKAACLAAEGDEP